MSFAVVIVYTPTLSRLFNRGEEMAGTAVYLASKAGGYVTGQDVIIDGGYVTVNPAVA